MREYSRLALETEAVALEAADYIKSQASLITEAGVETKGLHNYVTRVDRTAEEMIVQKLRPLLPGAGFITEEETDTTRGLRYNWVIDPLDGTTNFIHGVPLSSVSIALMEGDETIIGSVTEVHSRESFLAWKDGPALRNGQAIHVSQRQNPEESLLVTGFPYYDYDRLDAYLRLFRHFMKTTRGLRRLGSAALDLAWVACGRFDAFYEYGLNPWDVAAGAFIVERAGGKNTDFEDGKNFIFGKEILSSNGLVHSSLLTDIRRFFANETFPE